jgi:hypothetical protein
MQNEIYRHMKFTGFTVMKFTVIAWLLRKLWQESCGQFSNALEHSSHHQPDNSKQNLDNYIERWNSISFPCGNITVASLQIEGGEFQLDHPFCWRGYGDNALPFLTPVVAWKVGRLDNTSRWRQIGAHISTRFAPARICRGVQFRDSIKREKITIHSVVLTSSLLGQSIQVHYLDEKRSNWKESLNELC